VQYGNANPLNAFLIYTINLHDQISGYTATSEKIFPVEVTIRELTPDERLLEKELKIEFTTKILLPKDSSYSDFNLIFSEKIGSETMKFLSRSTIYIDNAISEKNAVISADSRIEIIPRKAVEIEDIGKNRGICYRVFMEESETITDLEKILKQLTDLPHKKSYDILFYEKGQKLPRNTLIKNIKHPLTWSVEKSTFLPVFRKFYNFWKDFFKILRRKKAEEELLKKSDIKPINIFKNFYTFWSDILEILQERESDKNQKTFEDSEIEATDQHSNNSANEIETKRKKADKQFKKYKLDYYT
ncbi:MAG: hypothetical protein ACFFD2_28345, partial [Promethearchaeota archaeon]